MKVINYFKNVFINLFASALGLVLITVAFIFFMVYATAIAVWKIITGEPGRLESIKNTTKIIEDLKAKVNE